MIKDRNVLLLKKLHVERVEQVIVFAEPQSIHPRHVALVDHAHHEAGYGIWCQDRIQHKMTEVPVTPPAGLQTISERILISLPNLTWYDQIVEIGMRVHRKALIGSDSPGNIGNKDRGAWKFVVNVVLSEEAFHKAFDEFQLVLLGPLWTDVIEATEPRADAAQAPNIERNFRIFLQRLQDTETDTDVSRGLEYYRKGGESFQSARFKHALITSQGRKPLANL